MRNVLQFHLCHGIGLELSENATLISRPDAYCNGIAFSDKPIKTNQKVCIELVCDQSWSGALRLGLTQHDPGKLEAASLPRFACPDLTNKPGYWARALDEKYASTGNRMTFYINNEGQLHYFINKQHKGIFLARIPTDKPLWVLFDIYGSTTAARLVPPDEAPVEIVARGSEALQAYRISCECGTRPVFRTRLMLVGEDRVGKTSLKKALTGQRHNQTEESTDGIDLSASCSFNLRDRQAWKLALADRDLVKKYPVSEAVRSLEEEYDRALAANIVQELLYLEKQKKPIITDDDGQAPISSPKLPNSDQPTSKQHGFAGGLMNEDRSSYPLLQEVPDVVVQYVMDMIAEHATDNSPPHAIAHNGRNITLNIWDFAGQSLYYTTHQVFLSSRAVYLIVFNLRNDLDSPVSDSSLPSNDMHEMELSHLAYMDFWLNSIHAHTAQNTRDGIDNTTLSPPIFIVGTHRGCLDEDPIIQEKLAEKKFDRIRQHLAGKAYERHLVDTFYAVENDVEDGEDEEVMRLRRHIEEVSSKEPYMGEQIPIKWLQFEQRVNELVENGNYFSSRAQIQEIAMEIGVMLESEFETLLDFYHDLGVIIHYGNVDLQLNNIIILKPQWLIDMIKRVITSRVLQSELQMVSDFWQRMVSAGLLEERLLDFLWSDNIAQKRALLALMEKLDLIAECHTAKSIPGKMCEGFGSRLFYVPCRLTQTTDDCQVTASCPTDVTFYVNFNGFLPDGLFHRVLTRALRWSQSFGNHEPRLYFRFGRFFLDKEHDFILQMAPLSLARIKVTVMRQVDMDDLDESSNEFDSKCLPPPRPSACAKVRNFLETVLTDLRELWMKRMSYRICVRCTCNVVCQQHTQPRCQSEHCIHFLNLDECLTNKVVCCGHRRIKTALYRKWFPASVPFALQEPLLNSCYIEAERNHRSQSQLQVPLWIRSAAKLLNGGPVGQDWLALAKRLEYKKTKIERFMEELNPALCLLTDWIILSGNTSFSLDIIIAYLEQMQRNDIVEILQQGKDIKQESPQVFISYHWDCQDEVNALRKRLESAGYSCWMDIGQMGGGDLLYTRIDQGIRNSKVVIACLSPKYIVSHMCNKELSLADLLRKPIIPIMYERIPWPPPGGMALTCSQLVYINMNGVGGHGGSGIHADRASKYHEIIQRVSAYATSQTRPRIELLPCTQSIKVPSLPSSNPSVGSTEQEENRPVYLLDSSGPEHAHYMAVPQANLNTQNLSGIFQSNQVEQVHVEKCAVCTIL